MGFRESATPLVAVSVCVVGQLCACFLFWRGPNVSPDSLNENTCSLEKLGTASAAWRGKSRTGQVSVSEPRTVFSENTEHQGLGNSRETLLPPLLMAEISGCRKALGFPTPHLTVMSIPHILESFLSALIGMVYRKQMTQTE